MRATPLPSRRPWQSASVLARSLGLLRASTRREVERTSANRRGRHLPTRSDPQGKDAPVGPRLVRRAACLSGVFSVTFTRWLRRVVPSAELTPGCQATRWRACAAATQERLREVPGCSYRLFPDIVAHRG